MCFGVFERWSSPRIDVADPHRRVVHDDGEVVERRAVRPDDDEVAAERGRVDLDVAADDVVEGDDPGRDAEPDGRRAALGDARGPLLRGQDGARPHVPRRLVGGLLPATLRVELVGRAEARVREVGVEQPTCGRLVEREAGHLPVRTVRAALVEPGDRRPLVPLEAEPVEAVEDVALERRGGPRDVRVLEPEDERAPDVPGEEEVEQGGPRGADVERPGGARRDAHADVGARGGLGHVRMIVVAVSRPGRPPRARGCDGTRRRRGRGGRAPGRPRRG